MAAACLALAWYTGAGVAFGVRAKGPAPEPAGAPALLDLRGTARAVRGRRGVRQGRWRGHGETARRRRGTAGRARPDGSTE